MFVAWTLEKLPKCRRKSIHTVEPLWVTISLQGSPIKVKPHETVTVLTWSLDRTVSSNRIQA